MNHQEIILKKVQVHNLKNVDLTLPKNCLIVFTGVSGSGKSSLAFDTIYVEGQRRYIESLSTFARRQLGEMSKPNLESASGITPTIAIEQKSAGKNPRSTVGTLTEIYDYLRILYARIGVPHCPVSGEAVLPQSRERIIKIVQALPEDKKVILLAPYVKGKKGEFKEDFQELLRKGFTKVRIDENWTSLETEIELDGNVSHDIDVVIDRFVINKENHSRIAEGVTNALNFGNGVMSHYFPDSNEETLYSMHAYSPKSGLSYSSLEPHDFSFNSPSGMCSRCNGLGVCNEFKLDEIIDPNLSIAEDCCSIASSYQTVRYGNIYENLAKMYHFSTETPWKKLSEQAKKVFLYGGEKKWIRMRFTHPITGATWIDNVLWKGVLHEAHTRFSEAKSDGYRSKMQKLMHDEICPECLGSKLKPYPSATLFYGKKIHEVTALTVEECLSFFNGLSLTDFELKIADELLKEIKERLKFLQEVGLHYLTLDRTTPTLSGGEAQRVRLASQIGCGLVGITYVLDEPSIGLHPRDNKKLIGTLQHLRDMGNTVIVVEHDEETIWHADQVVDVGPGPGSRGGEIVVNGSLKTLLENKKSITAAYLRGDKFIPIPKKRRKPFKEAIEIHGARHHNLKNINVKIPLGIFIAVTGVSGSGKSSLISDILYPALSNYLHKGEHTVGAHNKISGLDYIDKVIAIDQSPIGRNPRSNPSTYIKLFDEIRDLFSTLPESRARGYKPGRFSFNVKEGSCPQCEGMGLIKIDMDFMEDAWVECPLCHQKRFDHDTLSVLYKGKNIYDVLEMEVIEALDFFKNIPSIKRKLETLKEVGLEYLKLGQSSTTLSGGEAQRIKLAKELVRPATGKTLYIFDEPTTGLHFQDIKHLLEVLHQLVDRGNTVLVIEHNMDVVKTADWIVDLGPEGGVGGGKVVAYNTPEKIAVMDTPTGHAVKEALYHDRKQLLDAVLKSKKKEREPILGIQSIDITDAEQNNLKCLSVSIPRNKMTIFTGPSGSGKTSLAFETIYAEGERRYIESLSPYARQFVKQMPKPKVGHVEGLSPAIAIEQKAHAGNPRSTVGTMTEIYDYLRVLFARVGVAHCPETGEVIQAISKDFVVDKVLALPEDEKIQVLAPLEVKKNEKFEDVVTRYKRQGFLRIRLNEELYDLDQDLSLIPYDRKRKNDLFLIIDRLVINPTIVNRLYEAIETASMVGNGKLLIARPNEDLFFNLSFAVVSTGKSYPEITPHTFAFNTPSGMCMECLGLGYQYGANLIQKKEVMDESIASLVRRLWGYHFSSSAFKLLEQFLEHEKIDPYLPLTLIPQEKLHYLMNGAPEDKWIKSSYGCLMRWPGINQVLAKAGKNGRAEVKEKVVPLLHELICPSCQGARINPLARNVIIDDLAIHDLCHLPTKRALDFIKGIQLKEEDEKLLDEVKRQLISRLTFLNDVGLHYLSLDRKAPSLSGGEAQRIRLARQLGSGLTGVLYVLDEPTIGLHPKDNDQLNDALEKLKLLGNTMILVEHDPLTVQHADYLLDFGPQAGVHGGHITAKGTIKEIKKNKNSLTGAYLSLRLTVPMPSKRRDLNKGWLSLQKASLHNLKNVSLKFPVGAMSCVTGVSGSGKSTLMHDVVLPLLKQGLLTKDSVKDSFGHLEGISNFDRIIFIDQNPLGTTSRSDVGTYTDVQTKIREFYASLPMARMKGLQPKHFSYNHRKGMCTACWGLGYRSIYMHFLPPIKVTCDECKGLRLNPVSLEVTFSGKNLGEILKTTVDEARVIFQNHPKIVRILDTLISVGLGYLKLGQEAASLSGGEAQRLKLSRELSKRSTGKTIYMLDEPTTGLHSDDIKKLLTVLHKLVDKGNTMLIIEHNMDVIKNADYVVDLGPEAGENGGEVICTGTPEQILDCKGSHTAKYLKQYLKKG